MSTIHVNLPDDLHAYVEEKAKQGGFADAGEFIAALVAATSERRLDLELALIEGLESGSAEPWTNDDWKDLKRRVAGFVASAG